MITKNKLGIWMDHSIANIMELTSDPIETKTIVSDFTNEEKEITLHKNDA